MSEPAKFLTSFAQALSTMALYRDGHPARERAVDAAYEQLVLLQRANARPKFSFLGEEVVYGQVSVRELKNWDWAGRLANAGVQRLEFEEEVTREEFEEFLEEVMARLTLSFIDTTESRPGRRNSIRFGAVGIKGEASAVREEVLPTATITYTLGEEADAIRWLHEEVGSHGELPLIEAEAVVRSLSVAMHGDSEIVIPLLTLKEFDQYTTTHSLNVSVLTMALAEFLGMGPRDVRAFGVAGLLHDLGKVRIPKDILTKPGKLTDEERKVMNQHPVDGARIILAGEQKLDLAATVAYEHHIMLNGGGYPCMHFSRDCHPASKLVHVCDVFDALRTKRPYRDAWESERVLGYLEERSGTEFDPDIARSFVTMMRQWDKRVANVTSTDPIMAGSTAS
jgi:putative nucleotidyltransferase with HDIG domain